MKRKRNPLRFRKRQANNQPANDPHSAVLCGIRDQLQRGQYAQALAQIDQQVATNPDIDYKARLLSMAGDCLFKQGKFSDAAATYLSIADLVQARPAVWLRPVLGRVRSLLKDVRVADAESVATVAVATALVHEQDYQTQLAQAQVTVAAGGQAVIPTRPPSVSAVAGRLAQQFFAEGEPQIAKTLFQQALQLDSTSQKARLGLAEIALREKNGAEAGRLARETILTGVYHASTLPAWKLLLAASRQTGTDLLTTPLLNGLAQAPPKVRARAVLMIAKELRGQGDARWLTIANNWLTTSATGNTLIAAELRKLKVTHGRVLNAAPTDQRQNAQALLQTLGISPSEFLSAAKEIVRTTLVLNQPPTTNALLTQAANRFGPAKRPMFVHGMALACVKAKRSDLAIPLLQSNVANATGDALGKSLWALAKIQSNQGQHVEAAATFLTFSGNVAMPERLRLFARLQWALELFRAQKPELIEQAAPQLEAALGQIQDYEVLLDVARQLRYSRFQRSLTLAESAYQRGKGLATQAFSDATHPTLAAHVLFKFCRRACDFHKHDDIISTVLRCFRWSLRYEGSGVCQRRNRASLSGG